MYICIHICICMVYVSVHIYLYHIYIYGDILTFFPYIYMYVYIYIHLCKYCIYKIHVDMIYMCVYIHIYIYIYLYIYIIYIGYSNEKTSLKYFDVWPSSVTNHLCLTLFSIKKIMIYIISYLYDIYHIYIDGIMKTMYPPGYHYNSFVATHALGHMMFGFITCPSV